MKNEMRPVISGFTYITCVIKRHNLLFTALRKVLRKRNWQNWKINFEVLGDCTAKMKAERGLSIDNPNESWLESKGTWFTYVLLIAIGHLVILSVPFFDTPTAWTLTNTFHNVVSWHISCVNAIVDFQKFLIFEIYDAFLDRKKKNGLAFVTMMCYYFCKQS